MHLHPSSAPCSPRQDVADAPTVAPPAATGGAPPPYVVWHVDHVDVHTLDGTYTRTDDGWTLVPFHFPTHRVRVRDAERVAWLDGAISSRPALRRIGGAS